MKKFLLLLSILVWIWITSAYFPWKSERTCNNTTDEWDKNACEIEKAFTKFTETSGTREMSTTCCSFLSHYPSNYYFKNNEEWNSESWEVMKLHDLVLNLSSKIYKNSKNKSSTLNMLSLLFKSCSEKWKNNKIKAICQYFSYDLIGRNPKLSKVELSDILKTLKDNKKLIKRTANRSDFDENYTPINYHYSVIRSMYMIWDYALWIMDWYDFFKQDSTDSLIDWMRIMVLKAWDTHRQDFAEIDLQKYPLDYPLWDIELTFDWKNLYLNFQREYWSEDNIYYQWLLEWRYKFNEDWTRKLYQCNMITWPRYGEDSEKKKEKQSLSKCEQDLWITVTTIL
jgi:hypothetical protein